MELPIAKESYEPSSAALVRAVKRASAVYARTGADEQTLDCGVAFCSPARPTVPTLNFTGDLKPAAEQSAQAALTEIDEHFQQAKARCLMLRSAEADWPAEVAAAAEAQGYRRDERVVLILRDYRRPAEVDDSLQIIPARASYRELSLLFTRMAGEAAPLSDPGQWADAACDALDEARLEMFLARRSGTAVGLAGVLSLGQIGVIHTAWVYPEHRRQGVARTLMDHVMAHCMRAAFEQVLCDRPAADPWLTWCQRLGFAEVARYHDYLCTPA